MPKYPGEARRPGQTPIPFMHPDGVFSGPLPPPQRCAGDRAMTEHPKKPRKPMPRFDRRRRRTPKNHAAHRQGDGARRRRQPPRGRADDPGRAGSPSTGKNRQPGAGCVALGQDASMASPGRTAGGQLWLYYKPIGLVTSPRTKRGGRRCSTPAARSAAGDDRGAAGPELRGVCCC